MCCNNEPQKSSTIIFNFEHKKYNTTTSDIQNEKFPPFILINPIFIKLFLCYVCHTTFKIGLIAKIVAQEQVFLSIQLLLKAALF